MGAGGGLLETPTHRSMGDHTPRCTGAVVQEQVPVQWEEVFIRGILVGGLTHPAELELA